MGLSQFLGQFGQPPYRARVARTTPLDPSLNVAKNATSPAEFMGSYRETLEIGVPPTMSPIWATTCGGDVPARSPFCTLTSTLYTPTVPLTVAPNARMIVC